MNIFKFTNLTELTSNNHELVLKELGFEIFDTNQITTVGTEGGDYWRYVRIYGNYTTNDQGLTITYTYITSRDTHALCHTCFDEKDLGQMDYGGGFGFGYDWHGTYNINIPFGQLSNEQLETIKNQLNCNRL